MLRPPDDTAPRYTWLVEQLLNQGLAVTLEINSNPIVSISPDFALVVLCVTAEMRPCQRADPNSKSGHSPFAAALLNALTQSEDNPADLIPKGQGNGVITASELALYLRDEVEQQVEAATNLQQTPNLWPFKKHRNGEFVFLVPEYHLALPPAPELTKATNPWRGLESYMEEQR